MSLEYQRYLSDISVTCQSYLDFYHLSSAGTAPRRDSADPDSASQFRRPLTPTYDSGLPRLHLTAAALRCILIMAYSQREYSRREESFNMIGRELSPNWVLLGLLMREPMHGYELHQFFESESPLGRTWYLGISQTYKLLKELEDDGYVEATIETQDNRPDKKVYHVTASGREAFLDWLQKPVRGIRLIRVEFLGKLFLAQGLGAEMVERLIDGQAEACERLKRSLEAGISGEGFDDLVLRFRAGQIEAAIDWLDLCRAELLPQNQGTIQAT